MTEPACLKWSDYFFKGYERFFPTCWPCNENYISV